MNHLRRPTRTKTKHEGEYFMEALRRNGNILLVTFFGLFKSFKKTEVVSGIKTGRNVPV